MKALFIHDSRFVRTPDGQIFSRSSLSYKIWQRYLKYFDEITVIGRISDCTEPPVKGNLSSGPKVNFVGAPDDHSNPLMQIRRDKSLKIIRETIANCDAVIVRQSKLGWLAAQEAERRKIPWAVEVVGDSWNGYWYYGSLLGKLYAPIAWIKARRWIKKAKFTIYVTRQYLQKKYPSAGFSCGISDVQITPAPESLLEQKITRKISSPPAIGMIGSLFNRYKGLHVAMRALRRLTDQGIPLQLRVVGNGYLDAWRQEAKKLGVEHSLNLEGGLPSGDPIMQWLDHLDIYIQPSLTEGLPRTVIEAMSRGLPILASNCGGIPELLPQECLHHPGDDKKLAEDLKQMIQNHTWRTKCAKLNFNEAKNYYPDRVEAIRDEFWRKFKNDAQQYKKHD